MQECQNIGPKLKECKSCNKGEQECKGCKDCGWCVNEDNEGNLSGNCVNPDFDNENGRPSQCQYDWEFNGVDYGQTKPFYPKQKCTMGGQEMKNQYAKYGCNLYNKYNECLKTSSRDKCIKFPDNGGFGCPGNDFEADPLEPIDPITNENNVCKYVEL